MFLDTSLNTMCVSCEDRIGYQLQLVDGDVWCMDLCGDGRKNDYNECDDGNLQSSDGCNSLCVVEKNWKCSGGTFSTPDYCTYTRRPKCLLRSVPQIATSDES